MPDSPSDKQAQARVSLGVYLGLVILGSAPLLWFVITSGLPVESAEQLPRMIALMWVPAIASVVTRIIRREGFRDVSFRLGGWRGVRAIGLAIVFPAIVGLIAYGVAWGSGLAEFALPANGWFSGISSPPLRFAAVLIASMLLGSLVGVITAAGEEIGWRGFMLTRLVDGGVPHPLLVSGVVWGLWHVPGILSGQYAAGPYPWLSALLFLVLAIGISVFWGKLRLQTGSVWCAVLGHSAWNAVIEGPFTSYTRGSDAALWVGESGIIVVIVVGIVTFVLARSALRTR
ncbi:MAG: CPBP family intramembrane glutamic endopeptidase [Bacteroidota bacterium]